MVVRIDSGAPNLRANVSDELRPPGSQALAGAVMDAAGDIAQIGMRIQRDQLQRQEEDNRKADAVWLARASADARIKWSKDLQAGLDGYDGSAPGFADGYLERYRKDAADQVAKAPERVRAQYELELIRQGEVLAGAAIEAESGRREAYTLNGIGAALDTEAEALVTQPDLFPDAVENITQIVAGAPPALREKLEGEALTKLASAYAEGLLDQDPQRLVSEIEGGLLDPSFTAGQKSTWLNAARGQAEKNETEARLTAERTQRELEGASRDYVSRVVAFYNAGLAPPKDLIKAAQDAARRAGDAGGIEQIDLARYRASKESVESTRASARSALEDMEGALKLGLVPGPEMVKAARDAVSGSKSPDLVKDFNDMLALAGKQQDFAFMAPDAISARRRELMATPATRLTTKELQLLDQVEAGRDKAIAGGNLVGWAATNGVPLSPIRASDEAVADQLAGRIRTMEVVAQTTGAPLQIFGKDEAAQFARELEQMPPDQRLRVLGRMTLALGPESMTAMREISKTAPVDAQAGQLLLQNRRTAAAAVVSGQAAIKANPKLAPPKNAEVLRIEQEVIGRGLPTELQEQRNAILGAGAAIYADRAQRGQARDGEFDEELWRSSLQQAAGRDGDRGGFGNVNGARVLMPAGMSESEFSGVLQNGTVLGRDAYRYSYGDPDSGKPGGPPAWRNQKTGELVRFQPDQLKNAKPIAAGPGLYWLSTTDPARGPNYVLDLDTGEPFVLDLREFDGGR